MNRNHTRFWFVILWMLLAPWAIQGLKAQDFQYVPNPENTPRWPPTPKPDSTYFRCAQPSRASDRVEFDKPEPMATVRTIHGNVQYSKEDQWPAVKPNVQFGPGTTLRTGADSYADVWVNGTSILRATADTTLQFQKMARTSAKRSADTETPLDLKSGSILGNIKKLSANSSYEITTPHGVARIRGGIYYVSVLQQTNGESVVTFGSATGEVTCSAVVDGVSVVKSLRPGECWTAGDKEIRPVPSSLFNAIIPVY